jgi:hypothetical protein
MVGTRYRVIRRRASKKVKTGEANGKEPQLRKRKSAYAEAAKRGVETRGAVQGAHPYLRQRRSGSILSFLPCISKYLTLTRNKGLLVSPFLKHFLDGSDLPNH